MQPITLSDDPRQRVDQILLAIGPITIELSGFDAVYLISGIQTLMTMPGFIDRTSIAGLRLKQFAERLQPHVYREPLVKDLIDNGWRAVEIAQQAYDEIKLEAEKASSDELASADTGEINETPIVDVEEVPTCETPVVEAESIEPVETPKLEVRPVLPKDMSKLKKIAKVANVKNFANLKKTALISALKSLPSDKLIAAIEQAN